MTVSPTARQVTDFVRRAADDAHALGTLSVTKAIAELKLEAPLSPYGAAQFLSWFCSLPVDFEDAFEQLIRSILKKKTKQRVIFNEISYRSKQDRNLNR